jgi:hypothetical protein
MESHDIELNLYNLLRGYIKMQYEGKEYHIKPPSIELVCESLALYKEEYDHGVNNKLYTHDTIVDLMMDTGEWSEDKEDSLEAILPKDIETLQIKMYENCFKPSVVRKTEEYLKKANDEMFRLYTIKSKYNQYTAENLADSTRLQHIIYNSTFIDGKRYRWNNGPSIIEVINYYNRNIVLPDQIREISRTNPWSNIWASSKANGGSVFGSSILDTTSSQQLLLIWSRFYDNIQESMESPPSFTIENDDMIDGWCLLQKRQREQREKESWGDSILSKNSKIKDSQEVFMMAETTEDANNIYDLNNPRARQVIRQRLKHIQKSGEVKQQEFSDVQQERMIAMTKALSQTMKGN